MKKFYVFNSFTDRVFCGNPAGVVPDADALDTLTMQAIARQLNLVETVFILKPESKSADCSFRYFTPEKELPIAGHPTIAGWACLAHLGLAGLSKKERYVQETGAGNIDIEFRGEKVFTSQKDAVIRVLGDFAADEFKIFGLDMDDVLPSLPVAVVDAGLGHLIFGVKSLDTLMKMGFLPDDLGALCRKYGARECQIFCLETIQPGHSAHTRNLCPRFGSEDPACGNGNAVLGAYFTKFVFPEKSATHFIFEQGNIINMPSIVEVMVKQSKVMIGGYAKMMVEGQIIL